jgi:hypothetical protein
MAYRHRFFLALALTSCLGAFACSQASNDSGGDEAAGELRNDSQAAGLSEGTSLAAGVIAVANDRRLTLNDYLFRVRISRVTAQAILDTRNGVNGVNESQVYGDAGTAVMLGGDDDNFSRLGELDALPGTSIEAFRNLADFAQRNGYVYGGFTDAGVPYDGGHDAGHWPSVDGGHSSTNPPNCPPRYSHSYMGQPCSPIGLTCAYPGQGDGTFDGGYATAMMWCRGPGGIGDAGGDAGYGTWVIAQ